MKTFKLNRTSEKLIPGLCRGRLGEWPQREYGEGDYIAVDWGGSADGFANAEHIHLSRVEITGEDEITVCRLDGVEAEA